MDAQKQLAVLTKSLGKLPPTAIWGLVALAAIAVAGTFLVPLLGGGDHYQYAFTNLSPEDSAEIAEHLKAAAIPFRSEAGGGAVTVPADKVYDARLLLASVGLPRGGGVGFELFDRGDLGVSEFTQRINLRRAIEGELARTIGHLAEVRSARVHLSFEEKTLFRDDEHKASAAVVINLQPGRILEEREVAGIRHLVASSVPGLNADAVTLVDGHGRTLTTDSSEQSGHQSGDLERSMEQRVVSLLETVAGTGAVVARVTATVDDAEITTNSEIFDPDSAALRSEHKSSQSQTQENGSPGQVAGAAANVPLQPTAPAQGNGSRGNSANEDQQRSYELSKTVTHTVKHSPRLVRLSAAVLVDGVGGKPRGADEVAKLGEIAKKAIGFDAARGDVFEISSEVFARSTEEGGAAAAAPVAPAKSDLFKWIGAGVFGLVVLGVLAFVFTRRRAPLQQLVLSPGATVSQLEQQFHPSTAAAPGLPAPSMQPALPDPANLMRTRALDLAKKDPGRAAHLLRAWIASDSESQGANNG